MALSSLTLGNNLLLSNGFNTRFQPSSVTLGSVWSTNLYYCGGQMASCAGNNGNLQEQDFTSQGVSYVQSYAYDALNRISAVGECSEPGCSFSWSQTFLYDNFGNRAVNPGSGNGTVNLVWTATAINQFNSKNQLFRGTGDVYDGAGNETAVASSSAPNTAANTMSYDFENRMVSANIGNTGAVNYTYDGDGRRVTKSAPMTVYVYDAAGNLAGEYARTVESTTGTLYLTGDHLGSTRVVTSATNTLVNGVSPGAAGTVVKCYDYMPFGEDIESGVGGRGSCYPSGLYPATPDALSVKFTGKERDAETGLDFFGARYMSSAQGRWTSPDLVNVTEERLVNPSSTLNKYAYAANNPLKFIDPDGRDVTYFYDQGGIAGHAVLFAYNPQGGDSAIESFGPKVHAPIWAGKSNFEMDSFASEDELKKTYASLTIDTTPELAQEVITYIRAHPDPALWSFTGPDCSSEVWKILKQFKLGGDTDLITFPGVLPKLLWNQLTITYNPAFWSQKPQAGSEYGKYQYSSNPSIMFDLLWQSLPQSNPKDKKPKGKKEVVTFRVCDSDGKNCE